MRGFKPNQFRFQGFNRFNINTDMAYLSIPFLGDELPLPSYFDVHQWVQCFDSLP
jgi:hypothetical protein